MKTPNIRANQRTLLGSKKLRNKPIFLIDDSLENNEILVTGITRDNYLIYWNNGEWHVDIVQLDPEEKEEPEQVLTEDGVWSRP